LTLWYGFTFQGGKAGWLHWSKRHAESRSNPFQAHCNGVYDHSIENVFVDALFQAFDAGKETSDLTIAQMLIDTVPLSKLMAEQIAGIRNWAKGRARPTASPQADEKMRRIAV
jgi:hypothetical protein